MVRKEPSTRGSQPRVAPMRTVPLAGASREQRHAEADAAVGDGAGPVALIAPNLGDAEALHLLRRGAAAVLTDPPADALRAALEVVAAAGYAVLPTATLQPPDRSALSVRERQVLALVVMDHSNAEIAASLVLSESTVKSHLSSAFGKLGVRSRGEARALLLDAERGVGLGVLAITTAERPR